MATQTATQAAAFTNSIGVQIHMGHNGSGVPYASLSTVEAALAYLNPDGIGTGVSTVRDETAAPASALSALGKLGYKLDMYTSYGNGGNNASTSINALTPLVNAGYVRMVEGPLEVDNQGWGLVNGGSYTALNGTTYSGWQAAVAWQKDLYSTFSGKTQVALFSLANPSDGAANSAATQAASQLGTSLGSITNLGNVHFYEHNGNAPNAEMPGVIGQETGYTSGKGFAITETGFNDANQSGTGYFGTPYANGVYTLDLVLDAYKAGASLTDIYELFDENMNYAAQGIGFEDHWGLFNSDGTPKPAATDLHNMMAVLGDTGSNATSFTPGSLDYSVSGLGSNGSSMLLQKSSGAYDVVVWSDANIDTNGKTSTAPTQNVTVNLGQSFGSVSVYDPLSGTSPVQTFSNVSSVQLGLTDHPLIIEAGGSGAPAPAASDTTASTTPAATGSTTPAATGSSTASSDTASAPASGTGASSSGSGGTAASDPSTVSGQVFDITAGGSHRQVISDFVPGTDSLHLSGYGSSPTDGVAGVHDSRFGTMVNLTDGTRIVLSGVHHVSANQLFS